MARNAYGEDLYFIKISESNLPDYLFETSLRVNIFSFKKLNKVIRVLINRKTSEECRKLFADIFFRTANEVIPQIERYYFLKEELDKYGKYNEAWSNTYEYLVNHYQLKAHIPFTQFRNESIFNEIKKAYEEEKNKSNASVQATKELFEENLISDSLKFAYVEVYVKDAKYFYQEGWRDDEVFEFYYMTTIDGKLLFLFLVNIR